MTNDQRPDDQARNAAEAQPNPNDPAVSANAGTPNYGRFGSAEDAANAAAASGIAAPARARNDGSNDNPDEFSEFRSAKKESGTEDYSTEANAASQAGGASYNGGRESSNARPEAFKKDEDVARAAFAEDDPRYAGGGTQSSWPSNEPAQEDTSMTNTTPVPNV